MKDTRKNILGAATEAFAELGYTAASVREICGRVGASPNAINYHFGSKEELYQEIIEGFASGQLGLSSRMLTEPPRSQEDFEVRLELFFAEVLHLYLENRDTVRILYREFEQLVPHGPEGVVGQLFKTNEAISSFVARGIERGFVHGDIDPDIVAGLLLDRVANQARFSEASKVFFDVTTLDEEYRRHWVRATLHIVFRGIRSSEAPATAT